MLTPCRIVYPCTARAKSPDIATHLHMSMLRASLRAWPTKLPHAPWPSAWALPSSAKHGHGLSQASSEARGLCRACHGELVVRAWCGEKAPLVACMSHSASIVCIFVCCCLASVVCETWGARCEGCSVGGVVAGLSSTARVARCARTMHTVI